MVWDLSFESCEQHIHSENISLVGLFLSCKLEASIYVKDETFILIFHSYNNNNNNNNNNNVLCYIFMLFVVIRAVIVIEIKERTHIGFMLFGSVPYIHENSGSNFHYH